jgi:hypothetical protein
MINVERAEPEVKVGRIKRVFAIGDPCAAAEVDTLRVRRFMAAGTGFVLNAAKNGQDVSSGGLYVKLSVSELRDLGHALIQFADQEEEF